MPPRPGRCARSPGRLGGPLHRIRHDGVLLPPGRRPALRPVLPPREVGGLPGHAGGRDPGAGRAPAGAGGRSRSPPVARREAAGLIRHGPVRAPLLTAGVRPSPPRLADARGPSYGGAMDEHPRANRPALLSFKFGGTALAGSLAMALVTAFAPQPVQIAALGSCVSVLAGLFVAYLEQEEYRERRRAELLERLRVPVALAPDHELFDQYCVISEALSELARQADPVLREVALLKLASLSGEVRSLARGTVMFTATETWRTVYERLLGQPGLGEYLSVAWVKTRDYWQDRPGRQSMRSTTTWCAGGSG